MTQRFGLALLTMLALALGGCEDKMEPKECDKLRGEAFDMLNKAQHCNGDADCRQSEWPGCSKPTSYATAEKIQPMSDAFHGGHCDEPVVECKEPPEAYCKQGLCVHREKSGPAAAHGGAADAVVK